MKSFTILFLADTSHPAKAVLDHIQAITLSQEHFQWHVVNPLIYKTLDKLDWSVFDAVGIHYSIKPYTNYYLSKSLKAKIADFKGLKFQFLQDEYQKVNLVQDYLYSLGIHILFTLVRPQYLDRAYPDPRLKDLIKIPVLTGYVPEYMKHLPIKPIGDRHNDLSYRARRCDYWLGQLAYEKQFIADEFIRRAQGLDLNLNISLLESDRVYGQAWLNLLQNSKAVLGTESGASIWDFDGAIENKTRTFLKQHKQAAFQEVFEAVLKPYDYQIVYAAISPRVFEAAATRTAMILFPGDYSHVCEPDLHYISLQKDFSNFDEVVQKLRNHQYLEQLTHNAFMDLIDSDRYSEQSFSNLIAKTLLDCLPTKNQSVTGTSELQLIKELAGYRFLNKIRRVTTETSFILKNGFSIVFDNRCSFKDKVLSLFRGIRRYMTYILQRI